MKPYDVIIIGAGAAGLMCAIESGKRGRSVLVLDHAKKPAEKIRISGGGRCNFTNIYTTPKNFLSQNPHFCVSALSRYTPADFIALVSKHNIAYHEKTLGQLFCDDSAQHIISMLITQCHSVHANVQLETSITSVEKTSDEFIVHTSAGLYSCASLVVACGGLSIPKMGATGLGYDIARQFNLNIIEPTPALVPFTLSDSQLQPIVELSGVAIDATVRTNKTTFREGMLFTHRGFSGPSMLQISSYWQAAQPIIINLAPDEDMVTQLLAAKSAHAKQEIGTVLGNWFPKRLVQSLLAMHWPDDAPRRMADIPNAQLSALANAINAWSIVPMGTEGYRTAEVTLGGVDTNALSSKTMECKSVAGLYFIGEVVDVTGHLGGFNFQWAWASGFAAGAHA